MPARRNQVPKKGASAGELVVHAHRPHGDVVLAGDDTASERLYIERTRQWFETQPEQPDLGLADADEARREGIRRRGRDPRRDRKAGASEYAHHGRLSSGG
jgi:hypothetical protein